MKVTSNGKENLPLTASNKPYIKMYIALAVIIVAILLISFIPKHFVKVNQTLGLKDYFQIQNLDFKESRAKGLLITDDTSPIIAVNLIFKGGSGLDPKNKEGLVDITTNMLLKGAGGLSSAQIAAVLKQYGISLALSVDDDNVSISMLALKKNLPQAFKILNLVLNQPNFPALELGLIKNDNLLALKLKKGYTSTLGNDELYKAAFDNNHYFLDGLGTVASIKSISVNDLKAFRAKIFTQNNLLIGASGDISKIELESYLNPIISQLHTGPEINSRLQETPNLTNKIIDVVVPNSTNSDIYVAMSMPELGTPAYNAALVFNQYFGSGDLNSLLMKEVRVKKGLVYTINSTLSSSIYGNLWVIHAVTDNTKVLATVNAIKQVLGQVKKHQIEERNIVAAQSYMEGNYFLNFTTNIDRATALGILQLKGYDLDKIYDHTLTLSKINKQGIYQLIDQYINPNKLLIVVAGAKLDHSDKVINP